MPLDGVKFSWLDWRWRGNIFIRVSIRMRSHIFAIWGLKMGRFLTNMPNHYLVKGGFKVAWYVKMKESFYVGIARIISSQKWLRWGLHILFPLFLFFFDYCYIFIGLPSVSLCGRERCNPMVVNPAVKKIRLTLSSGTSPLLGSINRQYPVPPGGRGTQLSSKMFLALPVRPYWWRGWQFFMYYLLHIWHFGANSF